MPLVASTQHLVPPLLCGQQPAEIACRHVPVFCVVAKLKDEASGFPTLGQHPNFGRRQAGVQDAGVDSEPKQRGGLEMRAHAPEIREA